MQLEEIITKNSIDLNLDASSKSEAILKLVDILYKNQRIEDKDLFLTSVMEREEIEPTDMGIGVAIPHGICDTVIQPSVTIGRLKTPIPWQEGQQNGSTNEDIYAIFLLASSRKIQGNDHLEMISRIASLLIEDDFIQILKSTPDEGELIKSIHSFLGKE